MKRLPYILFFLLMSGFLLPGCTQSRQTVASYPQDDLYYAPSDRNTRAGNTQADENLGSSSNPSSESAYRQDRNTAYGSAGTNGNGDTYINNNYYSSPSYAYSSRIRRYNQPSLMFGYYDPFFYPSYGMGWNSYSGWNMNISYGYNPFMGYNPYFGNPYGYCDPFYCMNYGYGGYYPYGYYNPYNSYSSGYYKGFYDANRNGSGGSQGGSGGGIPATYYGPRGAGHGGSNVLNGTNQQYGRVQRTTGTGNTGTGGNGSTLDNAPATNGTRDNNTIAPAGNSGRSNGDVEYQQRNNNNSTVSPGNTAPAPATGREGRTATPSNRNANPTPAPNNGSGTVAPAPAPQQQTPSRREYRPSYSPSNENSQPSRNNNTYTPRSNNNYTPSRNNNSSTPSRSNNTYTPSRSNSSPGTPSRSGGNSGGTARPRR